jgi:2,4-dienoyl-CoA reductase-like NADH-dependent reductase (Old Yellow Enzyme family)
MQGHARFPKLFAPITLGPITLPNRFVVAPMTTNFANPDGSVGDSVHDYLVARARGGFSLVITENIGVHPSGRVMPRMLMGHDDSMLPGLRRLATSVHAAGAKLIGQISHAGRQTKTATTGLPLVAPSPIPCPLNREMPVELTLDQVRQFEQCYIDAACRLHKSGFDGVELHGAHGYLIAEFLSNYSNKRTDIYGGPLENRMRFLLNIVRGIRAACPADFALCVRISAQEFVPDGIAIPEAIEIVKRLEAAGIDAISLSVGVYESFNRLSMITGDPEGQWLDMADQVRRHTRLPVMGVGRIKRAEVAEQALERDQVDIPLFGRASFADPELPNKIASGRGGDIIWCNSCNICLGRSARPETICPVNPAVGREAMFEFHQAARPRRIAIVGASWASLTAAWVAASRGHSVTVYDPSTGLGGIQDWRARVPGLGEFADSTIALVGRAKRAGVRFVHDTGEPADCDLVWAVRRYTPFAANTLTGGRDALSSYEVLAAPERIAGDEVALIGQDLATAEAALLLASRGKRVTLRCPARFIALDGHPGYRESTLKAYQQLGVTVETSFKGEIAQCEGALVIGEIGPAAPIDSPEAQWTIPFPTVRVDQWIDDAYEPNVLTRTVYEAADLALAA